MYAGFLQGITDHLQRLLCSSHTIIYILCLLTVPTTALFDAVLCSENNLKDVQSLLKEMYRVLKMGGVYLMISHGPPDNRVNHIKRYIDVDIDVVPIRKLETMIYC